MRLNVLYRGIAKCSLGNGSTILFWEDLWCPVVLNQSFPNLFQQVISGSTSVREILHAPDLASIFNLPLSQQAFDELLDLQDLISAIPYDTTENDHWSFVWGNDKYSSQKFYKLAFSTLDVPRSFSLLWKCQCTPRIKFFPWLVLVDRLNTKTMLRRKNCNMQGGLHCVLCHLRTDEDIEHLFFVCPFAVRCSAKIHIQWDLALDIHDRILQARHVSPHSFFMEVFLIAAWELWKLRNAIIFDGARCSFNLWIMRFKDQVQLQSLRFRHEKKVLVNNWISSH